MLNQAIKNTINYAAKFGMELTREQLKKRLISEEVVSLKKLDKWLDKRKYKLASKISGLFFEEKLEKAQKLANTLANRFPDILLIGVTGSVSAGNPKEEDDIDLMIITKTNGLWVTRLRLTKYIWENHVPHRKFNKPQRRDDFCFNLWLDELKLEIPKGRQNMRNAVDLIMMIPLVDKNNTYARFIKENSWVKKWVATGYSQIITSYKLQTTSYKLQTNFWEYLVNIGCFLGQLGYMATKLKIDEVGLRKAFFHPKMI